MNIVTNTKAAHGELKHRAVAKTVVVVVTQSCSESAQETRCAEAEGSSGRVRIHRTDRRAWQINAGFGKQTVLCRTSKIRSVELCCMSVKALRVRETAVKGKIPQLKPEEAFLNVKHHCGNRAVVAANGKRLMCDSSGRGSHILRKAKERRSTKHAMIQWAGP